MKAAALVPRARDEYDIEKSLLNGAFIFYQYFTMIPRSATSVLRQARTQLRPGRPLSAPTLYSLARLLSSLAVLEQRDGKLNHGSLGAVTAAQKLGGSITGFVAGGNIKSVAEEASKVSGLEKIIAVDNAAYDKVRHARGLDLYCQLTGS